MANRFVLNAVKLTNNNPQKVYCDAFMKVESQAMLYWYNTLLAKLLHCLSFQMNKITDRLYISSVEVASQVELLVRTGVKSVVSIGCEIGEKASAVEYLSFAHILDTPETNILNIFDDTNSLIHASLSREESVLVHCVYGQSRSATIIVAYLLYTGMKLTEAIDLIKAQNPTTCINPGFLAQLYFLSVSRRSSIERTFFKLTCVADLRTMPKSKAVETYSGTKRALEISLSDCDVDSDAATMQQDSVVCRQCKANLSPCSDVLTQSIDTVSFVKAHEDGFWCGYRPSRSKTLNAPVVLPEKGIIAVNPPIWMVEQVHQHREKCGLGDKHVVLEEKSALSGDECDLTCPSCLSAVGIWRSKGLNLVGEYNLCDLYAYKCDLARVKKVRHLPML